MLSCIAIRGPIPNRTERKRSITAFSGTIFIAPYLNKKSNSFHDLSDTRGFSGKKFWIGLSDAAEEGRFVWSDGTEGTEVTHTNWTNGGNGDNDDTKDCVYLQHGAWHVGNCNDNLYQICEQQPW